jgi:DNA polymerase-3 subunit beta
MKFSIQRESLLRPLQLVCGVVERRQTLPVLSNLLLRAGEDGITLITTDLEVEMVGRTTDGDVIEYGEVTIPARKFLDICRALPEGISVELRLEKERAFLRAGKSRFTLSTLPSSEFPCIDQVQGEWELRIPQRDLRFLLERSLFCMAQQDVRYYLNGLLIEMTQGMVRAVSSDGHRLALCEMQADVPEAPEPIQVIVPRKGVLELARLLDDTDAVASVLFGPGHLRVTAGDITLTSKLIDGRFPNYQRVVPEGNDRIVIAERAALRETLMRSSILSNEKFRGVRIALEPGLLRATANNPEQEEAEEETEVEFDGEPLEIGFNASYLVEALGAVTTEKVELGFGDSNSSCRIQGVGEPRCLYVVMPMRL